VSASFRAQIGALNRKSRRMGLSTEEYIKQLIVDDLLLDRMAQTTLLEILAAPFRKALKGAGEEEIARIVSKARAERRRS
jgi:hypothetical protein